MSKILEDLLKWVNSEDGIKALEDERQKLLFLDKLSNKYIDKLHSLSLENRSELIDKIISKYESDEYKDREMFKLHYEPRNTLYWYLDDYAEKYGKELPNEENNPFPHSIRMIDNKYIVRKMYGQGTVIDVWKVE